MTLVILEGADGTGKSTLAREIFRHPAMRECSYIHRGPPTERSLLEEYLLPLAWYRADQPAWSNAVCDRWHLGELVYPKLRVGRKSLATREQFAYVDMWLRARGALLVHVTASLQSIYRRRIERGESVVNTAQINAECELFHAAFGESNLTWQPVSTSDSYETPRELADRIVKYGHAEVIAIEELASFTTYAGPPRPDLLLLGDERGPTDLRYPSAFVPLPATSGDYLLRALPDDLLCTGRVGLANANESDDPVVLWELLGRPPVVALGRKAYDGCVRGGLTDSTRVGAVPHPQWVRRFKHRLCSEYGKLIVQAAETKEDLRKWLTST